MDKERTLLKKEANDLKRKRDFTGAREADKKARDLRGKIQYLGKLGGGRWGNREVRRKNW